jgi:hypothetical protein
MPLPAALQAIVEALHDLGRGVDPIDLNQPVTSIQTRLDELQRQLEGSALSTALSDEELNQLQVFSETVMQDCDLAREMEESALEPILADVRLRHIFRLLEECDRSCRGSPLWILGTVDDLFFMQALAAIGPFFEAEQSRFPEILARKAQEAFLKISEPHYLEFLWRLLVLADVIRGQRRDLNSVKRWKLGDFLRAVLNEFPGADRVVEPDVQRIRNAIAHNSVYFDPRTARLVMVVGNAGALSISPEELMAKARAMFEVCILGIHYMRAYWQLRLIHRCRQPESTTSVIQVDVSGLPEWLSCLAVEFRLMEDGVSKLVQVSRKKPG